MSRILGALALLPLFSACDSDGDNIMQNASYWGTVLMDETNGTPIFRLDNTTDLLKGELPAGITVKAYDRAFLYFDVNYSQTSKTSLGTAYKATYHVIDKFDTGTLRPFGATTPAKDDKILRIFDPWITYLGSGRNVITFRTTIKKSPNFQFYLQYENEYHGEKVVPLRLYFDAGTVAENAQDTTVFQSFVLSTLIMPDSESGVTNPLELQITFNAENSGGNFVTTQPIKMEYYPTQKEEEEK